MHEHYSASHEAAQRNLSIQLTSRNPYWWLYPLSLLNPIALRKSCEYMGRSRKDGEVFNTGCGFCECLDGEVTCYEDLVPNVDGELNATQLKLLKEIILQIYFFQFSQEEHVLIDIRHINQHPSESKFFNKSKTNYSLNIHVPFIELFVWTVAGNYYSFVFIQLQRLGKT